jgi:hypothetical protein
VCVLWIFASQRPTCSGPLINAGINPTPSLHHRTSRRLISPLAKSSKVVRIDLPWHNCEFTDHSILCANLVSKTSCLPFLKSGATVSWPGRCRLMHSASPCERMSLQEDMKWTKLMDFRSSNNGPFNCTYAWSFQFNTPQKINTLRQFRSRLRHPTKCNVAGKYMEIACSWAGRF